MCGSTNAGHSELGPPGLNGEIGNFKLEFSSNLGWFTSGGLRRFSLVVRSTAAFAH